MTNDESEIRRLEAFCESAAKGERTAGDIEHFITEALAAEREQHARDVAAARAAEFKAMASCVRAMDKLDKANAAMADLHERELPELRRKLAAAGDNDRKSAEACEECGGSGQITRFFDNADGPSTEPCDACQSAEARARALNDSRKGEAAAEGRPTSERAPAVPAPPPPPPSGINQGSGAGDCACNYDPERTDGKCPAHGRSPLDLVVPSPASPTGETRDEGPVTHASLETRLAVAAMTPKWPVQPPSAPGGALGVEAACSYGNAWCGEQASDKTPTVRIMGHSKCARVFCSPSCFEPHRTACTGTTPTPGTETPTGGRG